MEINLTPKQLELVKKIVNAKLSKDELNLVTDKANVLLLNRKDNSNSK